MSTSGPAGASSAPGSSRLQHTQHQVDEVVDIMRVNVDKVLERDQKLSELDDRADALQAGAAQFETNAAKLKRKYWWKNCKFGVCPHEIFEETLNMKLFSTRNVSLLHLVAKLSPDCTNQTFILDRSVNSL
ncbi:vesicle-associated membrane protein 3 isoform X1 [Rhineura floridana]|uniref:vesicle-associated membrane protein 3 isoform X1 n=1 Tax=Rhineura floridana TaxID=261503 RepID=UPI002AC893F7|nr:vesicle-associated membrane protein 3 isoform X1 [Rhineura floridana]